MTSPRNDALRARTRREEFDRNMARMAYEEQKRADAIAGVIIASMMTLTLAVLAWATVRSEIALRAVEGALR